jgi:hypothetical protein
MIIPHKIDRKRFLGKLSKQIDSISKTKRKIKILIITDYPEFYQDTDINIVSVYDINEEFLNNNKKTRFIYAVENNSVGLPVIRAIIRHGMTFYGGPSGAVGGYVYDNKMVRDIIEEEYELQETEGVSKFSDPGTLQDYVNLCQAIESTKNIEGDIVEIGVYRGSSSSVILKYLERANIQKSVWLFDTFEGFCYQEAYDSVDQIWNSTHKSEGYADISTRLKSRAPGRKNLTIDKLNIISNDLPLEIKKIAMCNIDVDMFEAVESALNKVAPLMAVGGIMICEDAGHTPMLIGARLALENFLISTQGVKFTPVHVESGQVFLIKHS